MVPIIIEKTPDNWTVYIVTSEDKAYEVGVGKTCAEAVGDLVLKNLITFNISINAIKE